MPNFTGNTSRGEQTIIDILRCEGIAFEREKTFNDLKRGRYRFDFYIPSFNMLIEYDGEQHMNYTKFFYKSEREFKAAKERDRCKNSFALAHDMLLYRIPYWELENIHSFNDIRAEKFHVKSKYHNDYLVVPKK